MRSAYLICYDIRHPKRLRKVFQIMKGYGEHWQFSIFFCVLKDIDRVRLQAELEEAANLKEDQIMIINMGSNATSARKATTIIGTPLKAHNENIIVV